MIGKKKNNITKKKYSRKSNFVFDKVTGTIERYKGKEDICIVPPIIKGIEVKAISKYAFNKCTSLSKIELPESITYIGNGSFSDCERLVSINIPDGITTIGDYTFSSCKSLKSIDIPNSVTSIGASAFSDCYKLSSIDISNVTHIGKRAFADCTSLTTISIPDSITYIDEYTFSGCEALASVDLSSNLVSIDKSAFSGCTSLSEIDIPDSVVSIGHNAFKECDMLADTLKEYKETHPLAFSKAQPHAKELFQFDSETGTIKKFNYNNLSFICTIPPVIRGFIVRRIGEEAFKGGKAITEISIPNYVTSIGDDAFSLCTSLKRVVIPDSVTDIGERILGWHGEAAIVCSSSSYAQKYAQKNGIKYKTV